MYHKLTSKNKIKTTHTKSLEINCKLSAFLCKCTMINYIHYTMTSTIICPIGIYRIIYKHLFILNIYCILNRLYSVVQIVSMVLINSSGEFLLWKCVNNPKIRHSIIRNIGKNYKKITKMSKSKGTCIMNVLVLFKLNFNRIF